MESVSSVRQAPLPAADAVAKSPGPPAGTAPNSTELGPEKAVVPVATSAPARSKAPRSNAPNSARAVDEASHSDTRAQRGPEARAQRGPEASRRHAEPRRPLLQPDESENKAKPKQESSLRRIVIDPTTRDAIFQVVSKRTGDVVNQVPSEALLQIRRYAAENLPDPTTHSLRRSA